MKKGEYYFRCGSCGEHPLIQSFWELVLVTSLSQLLARRLFPNLNILWYVQEGFCLGTLGDGFSRAKTLGYSMELSTAPI